jgi:hypothetical protein
VNTAWKYSLIRSYPYIILSKLRIWAHTGLCKLAIFGIFEHKTKNTQMANLSKALWAQTYINSGQTKHNSGLRSEYFQTIYTISQYMAIWQSRFFGKSPLFLLEDNETGMISIKMRLNSWNYSTSPPTFYLQWFGAETSPNDRVENIPAPL